MPQAHQSMKASKGWSCLWEKPSSPLHSQQEAGRAGFQLGALPLGFPSSFLPPPQEAGEFAPVIRRRGALSHSLHSCNDGNQGPARVSHQASVLGKPVPAASWIRPTGCRGVRARLPSLLQGGWWKIIHQGVSRSLLGPSREGGLGPTSP